MTGQGYKYDFEQKLSTDASINVDRGFIARFSVAATQAVALSANGIRALTNLGETAQNITTGLNAPAVPRGLSIVSNKGNGAGNVVIEGTNINNDVITETLALNGTTTRDGDKAFKTVTKVTLPAQTNTPVKQVETIAATNECTTSGDITVTVTSALFADPVEVEVSLTDTGHDTEAKVAAAVREALADDEEISEHFEVSGEDADIVLTAKLPAANDSTLDIAGTVGSTGVTFGASTATTAGVDFDKVSVGWNDKLGLPHKLARNSVLKAYLDNTVETTDPTVAVSATALESNTVDLHSALDGTKVDVDYIVG